MQKKAWNLQTRILLCAEPEKWKENNVALSPTYRTSGRNNPRKRVCDIQILTKAGIDGGLSIMELLVESYTV